MLMGALLIPFTLSDFYYQPKEVRDLDLGSILILDDYVQFILLHYLCPSDRSSLGALFCLQMKGLICTYLPKSVRDNHIQINLYSSNRIDLLGVVMSKTNEWVMTTTTTPQRGITKVHLSSV